jgi:hypothetical protein
MSGKQDIRNGAYCNKYGSIYLRVVSIDETKDGWPEKATDYGISIEEAHCITVELMAAICAASEMRTGRGTQKQEIKEKEKE